MASNYAAAIHDLPPVARHRAEAFIDEGNYYGWHLETVTTKPVGDMLECRLDFDNTTIIFLAQRPNDSAARAQVPAAYVN